MVAALRRFIARQGIPCQIVSDNATNFVGARRDLKELEKVVRAGAQSYNTAALSGSSFLLAHLTSANYGKQR